MQKDKKLVIAFLVILFGICLCIPCKFVLVKIGVMSMNMDNFLEYKEKDVNNVVDKINLNQDAILLNLDGTTPLFVHQYDRHEELENIFTEKYL